MPTINVRDANSRPPKNNILFKHQKNVFSQGGEDGVLEAIFKIIKPANKWCVEFGAWDGVFYSNTCNLIRNEGWSAVMIEGDPKRCAEITTNYPGNTNVYAMNEMVGFSKGVDTIDDILNKTPIPKNFDLISIDVDGIDWHIWSSIVDHRPRVVIIEINPAMPNRVSFVQDCDMGVREGSSLLAMVELGREKGYELVAVTPTNAIFVVSEEYAAFGIPDNSLDEMRVDHASFIFCGFNGKVYHTMPRLRWSGKHITLKADSLQLLAEHGLAHLKADQDEHTPPLEGPDLVTADGLVRETDFLRNQKNTLSPEEYGRRIRALWVAQKIYITKNRPWGAPPEQPTK